MAHSTSNKGTPPVNVVLYARASSDRQADKGLSIPAQLRELRKRCEASERVVLEEFVDEGYSGTTDQRPAFQAMIAYCKLHRDRVDAVLVWKNNRFARNRVHAAVYKQYLRNLGVDVVSITEPRVDSIDGELLEAVVEAVDGRFSKSLAQDVMRGMREVARRGFYPLATPPFGYRKQAVPDGKATRYRLVPDEETAPLVRRIFSLYVSGGLGAKATAQQLNEEGLTTPTGKSWTTKGVLRVLGNPAYSGRLVVRFSTPNARYLPEADRTIVVDQAYPPIIEPGVYQAAQSLRERRAKAHPRELASNYLLSRLLRCRDCGSKMYGVSAKSGRNFYYVCKRYYESGKVQCDHGLVRRDRLDGIVLEKVRDVLLEEENLRELVGTVNRELGDRAGQVEEERRIARGQLKERERQVARLLDALEDGRTPAASIRERLRVREEEVERLRAHLAGLEGDCTQARVSRLDMDRIRPYVESLKETLATAPRKTQQAILRSFIKKIEVGDDELSIEFTIPQPGAEVNPRLDDPTGVLGMVTSGTPERTRTSDLRSRSATL